MVNLLDRVNADHMYIKTPNLYAMDDMYENEYDSIVPRWQHAQDRIPDRELNNRYEEEALKWQRQDDLLRGFLSDTDKEKFSDAFATGDYSDVMAEGDLYTKRQFDEVRDAILKIADEYGISPKEAADWYVNMVNSKNSIRRHSIEEFDPSTQQGFASRLIFGDYDPESELEEPMSSSEMAADIGWGFTPLWGLQYGHELEKRWKRGYRPGLLEAGLLVAPFVARPAYKAGKAFTKAFKDRRAYEKVLRANALPMPKPNKKVFTGRKFEDMYIDPEMEFTPYEEVR